MWYSNMAGGVLGYLWEYTGQMHLTDFSFTFLYRQNPTHINRIAATKGKNSPKQQPNVLVWNGEEGLVPHLCTGNDDKWVINGYLFLHHQMAQHQSSLDLTEQVGNGMVILLLP